MQIIDLNSKKKNSSYRIRKFFPFFKLIFLTKFIIYTYNRKSKVSGDSLSELAELVSKGDEKGLFRMSLPASIEQIVKSENLEFCKNRTIYDHDYFHFIFEMVKISKV
jgi:hypothetical protein